MTYSFKLYQTTPLRSFIHEIKVRCIYCLVGSGLAFVLSYVYSEDLLFWFMKPNTHIHAHFIFLNISEALYTTLKVAGLTTLCTCIPLWWYHIWSFLTPSCTVTERKTLTQAGMLFLFVFGLSIWWTFSIGTPLLTKFLLQFQIQKASLVVEYQATLYAYVSWVWSCLIIVCTISQFPTVLFVAVLQKKITPTHITNYRKGIFILTVLVAACISPPDICIQCIFAVSIYVYIECIIWCLFVYTAVHIR